jgi:hypothetical protein
MTARTSQNGLSGHPITFIEIDADEAHEHGQIIEKMTTAQCTGVVVRGVLPQDLLQTAVVQGRSSAVMDRWGSPNAGMVGGEIRTIGHAATPTFTAFGGPTLDGYARSVDEHELCTHEMFDGRSPTPHVQKIFSHLFESRPARTPRLDAHRHWAPYNFRSLDPGVQIYSHHDNHYGLDIYQHLDSQYDRRVLLSWFVVLQAAESGGELIVYGLWGSDPNPPMLPTRFLDTNTLERDFLKHQVPLRAGDLVIFDSGRHVHRVTPVHGHQSRLTLGGFLTVDHERTKLAFWS